MKKYGTFLLVLLFTVGLLACGTSQVDAATPAETVSAASAAVLQDGVYFATEDEYSAYSGWKYAVTLVVENGKIASVDWDGAHKKGGESKKTQSLNGTYGMNGAEGTWAEQAEKTIAYFLGNYDSVGTMVPDAIAGVSMTIDPLFTLAAKALAAGPVGYGPYVDGAYSAIEPDTGGSWRYTASFTVISGYVVTADLDAVHKNGGETKEARSLNGTYGMNGAEGTWAEQSARIEQAFIENQGVGALTFYEGKTDDIAGVSITANTLFVLANEALVLR